MKLMFLFGNTAVGKMTVGQALTQCTPLRLFHNHMTIEPVLEIFDRFHVPAIERLRDVVFEEFAKTDHYGLIFTFMWDFDCQQNWDYIAHIKEIFQLDSSDVYYVELIASQAVRLQRNATENRLAHKASKRDIPASNRRLIDDDCHHRCVSNPGEIPFPNYLRLDNTDLSPQEAAQVIKDHFHLSHRKEG